MKRILLFLLLAVFAFNISGQNILEYKEHIEVPSVSKDQLFDRVKLWVKKTYYVNNKKLIDVEEKENERIEGTSFIRFFNTDAQLKTVASGYVSYRFIITVTDGAYDYFFTNFTHIPDNKKYNFGIVTKDAECPQKVGNTLKKSRIKVWSELKSAVKKTKSELTESLKKTMIEKASQISGSEESLSEVKTIEGIPADLNVSKVIFLKYETISLPSQKPEGRIRRIQYAKQEAHNKKVPKANADLEDAAKNYPFDYTIATRKDIEKLASQGYKYILDCETFENMRNGFRQDQSTRTTITVYLYKLYLRDMKSNTLFVVTNDFKENYTYFPKYIMNKVFIPAVKKKFK